MICAYEECGKWFEPVTPWQKFCHPDCQYEGNREMRIDKQTKQRAKVRAENRVCSVPGCSHPRGKKLRFLCDRHYREGVE